MDNTITVADGGNTILISMQGIQGAKGDQGIQGDKGDTGDTGPEGPVNTSSLPLAGGTMSGDIDMDFNDILNSNLMGIITTGAFKGVGSSLDKLDFTAFKVVNTFDDIAEFKTGSIYNLPADFYWFASTLAFSTDTINLDEEDGLYVFSSTHFNTLSYTGATPFISTNQTGVSLILYNTFMSTPNATTISLSNGNSLILEIPVFAGCKRPADLDSMGFCTLDKLAVVGCENGLLLTDVDTMSCQLGQISNGPNLGGILFDFQGANSGRAFISSVDSRPEATESYINVGALYGGDIDIVGGIHTKGGGSFFAAGSRDQTDPKILVSLVKNGPNSRYIGNIIVNGNTTVTTIVTQNAWVDVNFDGNAVESSNIERWSLDSSTTGATSYEGNEDYSGSIFGTFSVLSPGSQNYELRYLIDRGAGFVTLSDNVMIPFATDSATGTFPINIPLSAVTGDIIKLQVRNIDGQDDITLTHLSAGPANQ